MQGTVKQLSRQGEVRVRQAMIERLQRQMATHWRMDISSNTVLRVGQLDRTSPSTGLLRPPTLLQASRRAKMPVKTRPLVRPRGRIRCIAGTTDMVLELVGAVGIKELPPRRRLKLILHLALQDRKIGACRCFRVLDLHTRRISLQERQIEVLQSPVRLPVGLAPCIHPDSRRSRTPR